MFDRTIFSKRLTELKNKNNIMAKDIASDIGVSKQAFSQYEKQQSTPSADILTAIAEYFNVSLDYLTGRTDNPEIINNNNEQNISEDEEELLEDFRLLDKYEQNIILGKISEIIYNKNIDKNNMEVSEEFISIDIKDRLSK